MEDGRNNYFFVWRTCHLKKWQTEDEIQKWQDIERRSEVNFGRYQVSRSTHPLRADAPPQRGTAPAGGWQWTPACPEDEETVSVAGWTARCLHAYRPEWSAVLTLQDTGVFPSSLLKFSRESKVSWLVDDVATTWERWREGEERCCCRNSSSVDQFLFLFLPGGKTSDLITSGQPGQYQCQAMAKHMVTDELPFPTTLVGKFHSKVIIWPRTVCII